MHTKYETVGFKGLMLNILQIMKGVCKLMHSKTCMSDIINQCYDKNTSLMLQSQLDFARLCQRSPNSNFRMQLNSHEPEFPVHMRMNGSDSATIPSGTRLKNSLSATHFITAHFI